MDSPRGGYSHTKVTGMTPTDASNQGAINFLAKKGHWVTDPKKGVIDVYNFHHNLQSVFKKKKIVDFARKFRSKKQKKWSLGVKL